MKTILFGTALIIAGLALAATSGSAATCPDLSGTYISTDPNSGQPTRGVVTQTGCAKVVMTHGDQPEEWLADGICHESPVSPGDDMGYCFATHFEATKLVREVVAHNQNNSIHFVAARFNLSLNAARNLVFQITNYDMQGNEIGTDTQIAIREGSRR